MKTIPYLNFNGDCAEAFRFYAELLGGDPPSIMSFGDLPPTEKVPEEFRDRTMHAHLQVGDVVLMGSDRFGEPVTAEGIYVSLHADSTDEANRIFATLAEGGSVQMPIERTFWAERFGIVVDRFGTPWMLNYEGDAGGGS